MILRVVTFETAPQADALSDVQPVMLYVNPLKTASGPMTSDVRVGTIYSFPSSTKELLGEFVIISNSPFL